jgi:predicted nucleotidyltransferase
MTFDWTIKITDIAIIFATILGPVLAVQAQKWLERNREVKQRRAWIFRTLMATRATTLSPAHVEALNAVPIEFYGRDKKLKTIIDKWKAYLDHLGQKEMVTEVWVPKRVELFVDMLHEMASFLGYEFNRVEITNEIYSPEGHAKIETDQEMIRRGLALLLSGQFALPMEVKKLPIDPAIVKEQEELRRLLLGWLNGEKSVVVEMKSSDK